MIEEGKETELTHGSGVGLWLIHWAMSSIRGDASFEQTDTGARVTLLVPALTTAG